MLFRRTRRWRQWGKAQGAAKFRDDSRCLSTPQRQRDYPVAPPSHPYRQPFLAFPSFISLGIDRDEDLGRGQSRFIASKPFLITILNERVTGSFTLACGVFVGCALREMSSPIAPAHSLGQIRVEFSVCLGREKGSRQRTTSVCDWRKCRDVWGRGK